MLSMFNVLVISLAVLLNTENQFLLSVPVKKTNMHPFRIISVISLSIII